MACSFGDVEKVDVFRCLTLDMAAVWCWLWPKTIMTDKRNMLNTNVDTELPERRRALSGLFDVTLVYRFEKKVYQDE